jgi:hypothetical protein
MVKFRKVALAVKDAFQINLKGAKLTMKPE